MRRKRGLIRLCGRTGKPTAKIIAECADMYAFAAKAMGASWQAGNV